jgi:outer membrane immunogenic protein
MHSTNKITLACGLAALALPSVAFAQEEECYFDGPYISGTISLEDTDGGSDRLIFDTDADGAFDDTVRTGAGADAFSPGFCAGEATAPTVACRGGDDDIGFSVRAGYDRHLGDGPIVAGILVEGAKPGVEDFVSGFSTTPASYTIGREIDWAVTGRARLGFAPGEGRALFYGTGGAGFAKIEHRFATSNTANSFTPSNEDDWQFGWQAGGGAEIMLTRNLGIGLEYLYSSFNDDEYVVAVGAGTAPPTNPFLLENGGTDLRGSSDRFEYHSLRASVNLRF